jgi:hypothetical protein
MPSIVPKVAIDMTGFNRGFALASQFTRKTPAEACNYAGKEIAFGAYQNTNVVLPQVVDSELAVISMPVIGVRGKPLKNRKNFFGKVGTSAASSEVPLAVLIIAARSRPGSRYNALTNNRYALPSWPFKGIPKRAGAWLMSSLVNQMVKARHKSGGFVRAGWLPAIKLLSAKTKGRFQRNGPSSLFAAGTAFFSNNLLGDATPAQEGHQASCVIENDVGLAGQNAESHNRALMEQASALQSAIDGVGRKEMDYYFKKVGREELEIPVNNAWK